jgi:transcription initiation factor TFIID TATA-box-binding protein
VGSWEIVNIVTTADLKQKVNIKEIDKLPNTIHDSEIYRGRVTYLKTPKMYGKVTIFASGKLISVGTKSPEQAVKDLSLTAEILTKEGFIKAIEILTEIRNIVALASFEISFNLEELSDIVGAMYEPEQFPGAILKIEETNTTYLIFQSGKVIISGTSIINELERSYVKIRDILLDNKENN